MWLCRHNRAEHNSLGCLYHCITSVAIASFFSLDLGFLLKFVFFDSGQILEMYVVLLYFPFKDTVVVSQV